MLTEEQRKALETLLKQENLDIEIGVAVHDILKKDEDYDQIIIKQKEDSDKEILRLQELNHSLYKRVTASTITQEENNDPLPDPHDKLAELIKEGKI